MKIIKKCALFLLLALFAISCVACESAGPEEIIDGRGYVPFESLSYNFRILYPSDWILFGEETLGLLFDMMEEDPFAEDSGIDGIPAMWYDFGEDDLSYLSNTVAAVIEGYDISSELFDTFDENEYFLELLNLYLKYFYEGFDTEEGDMFKEASIEELGLNNFLTLSIDTISEEGEQMTAYLAMTGYNGATYMFVFVTYAELYEEALPVFKTMLSTLEFIPPGESI